MSDVPKVFRVMLQVDDLEKAVAFYSGLMDVKGRLVGGGRAYFDCGPVILAVLDATRGGGRPKPNGDHIYFSVRDIEKIHARARALACLSRDVVHEANGGEVTTRPWGERSFYAVDPFGNALCFVDEKTIFTGMR